MKKTKPKKESKEKEYQDKIDELTDLLKRTQADFINYKARIEKESNNLIQYASADVIKKILPVLDTFEIGIKNTKDPDSKKGMEMMYAQLFDVLRQEGLSVLDCEGKFDPYKHEVLMKTKSDKPENTILEVLQKGYMFKDKIIRHAKVKVSG